MVFNFNRWPASFKEHLLIMTKLMYWNVNHLIKISQHNYKYFLFIIKFGHTKEIHFADRQ